ncbi:MAG: hypothetical protein ACM3O3_10855 [Syntrophothermus sp.]
MHWIRSYVAAGKNASAMSFTSTKISHLARLQGKIERMRGAIYMIAQM